jgi:glycosyltransferase involved in cell wall biosynthesis
VTTIAEVIPTGLEPESFVVGNGDDFRKKYSIELKRPMLLFVGRVAHEKNIGFLLQVVARVKREIPDILFMIAGEGPAREGLEHVVKKLDLTRNVKFIGYLDRHTELASCYHSADIFVFSSRTETQGLVLLEAMAQGVPVVSTAEMGTRDVLREGAGVWIAKEELEDFSGKIVKMLGDASARARLGEAGRDYAHEWSAGKQAGRMLAFYQSIIKSGRKI